MLYILLIIEFCTVANNNNNNNNNNTVYRIVGFICEAQFCESFILVVAIIKFVNCVTAIHRSLFVRNLPARDSS